MSEENRKKSSAITAIMENSQLADDIFAGQEAPLGSTKRKKANSILSNVYNGITGGQSYVYNGVGADQSLSFQQPSQKLTLPTGNTEGLPGSLPIPPKQVVPTLDSLFNLNKEGKAVPTEEGLTPDNSISGSYRDIRGLNGNIGLSPEGKAEATSPGLVLPGNEPVSGGAFTMPGEVPEFGKLPSVQGPILGPEVPTNYKSANTVYNACYNDESIDPGDKTKHEYCRLEAERETGKTPTVTAVGDVSPDDMASTAADTSPVDIYDMIEYGKNTGDWSELIAWKEEIDKTNPDMAGEVSEKIDTIIEALAGGMTLDEFKNYMIFNPKMMAEKLGIPLEIVESFPFDLFGTKNAEDIEELARQKKGLYAMEAELLDMNNEHITAPDRFKNYIREKDQYLGHIDKMIYEHEEKRKNMDMSDPYVAARYNNYHAYLTRLRGAQNRRYINILNDSIEEENRRYEAFTNLYETKVQEVTDFVERETGRQDSKRERAQELMPYITQSLTDIWEAENGIDRAARERERLENEKLLEILNIKYKNLQIQEMEEKIGKDEDGEHSMTPGTLAYSSSTYKSVVNSETNSDGRPTFVEVFGAGEILQKGRDLGLKNIKPLLDKYASDVSMLVEDITSETGNAEAALQKYVDATNESIENGSIVTDEEIEAVLEYLTKVYEGSKKGMLRYLVDNKSETMKNIMRKMLANKIDSVEELKDKFGKDIDENLLENLWMNYERVRQNIFEASPGMYESLDDVPAFGIPKEDWDEILTKPDMMALYFLDELE